MFSGLLQLIRGPAERPDFAERIGDQGDWVAMSVRHGHHTVARVETIKFVIDLHDSERTYFLNSSKWFSHFDFVQHFIDPHVDYKRFIVSEYRREHRRFLLGSVMHYLDGDHWTLELDHANSLAADWIAWMLQRVVERVAIATNLRFRPLTLAQSARIEPLGNRLPVLSRDAINATVEYQPVVLGVAYGYIRLVRGALDVSSVRPNDIVVIDHVPIEIPPVAALVTSELQAALAHVAILCRNRNTPDMALRTTIDLEAFQRLEGELVKLTVAAADYSIDRADRSEAEAAWAAARPSTPLHPDRDLTVTGLLQVDALPVGAIKYVGAKAAQSGELCGVDGVTTPTGFVLPFSAYTAQLDSAGLTDEIDTMLADVSFQLGASARAARLARLRTAILAHPVDADLLCAIDQKLRTLPRNSSYIFRSSTNAEDLSGFNGAGLYESIAVPACPTVEQIADALRLVWASVWLQRAFEERDWYRIDHRTVAMAVLIQPYIDGAIATGVAITENPFKEGQRGVFINAQTGGTTVTGAIENELPEQYLVSIWTGQYSPELISHSSLTNGKPILTESDLHELTDLLLRIHDAMLPKHAERSNAMDVEFALTAERRFVILQARPYNVVYNLDRAEPAKRTVGILGRTVGRVRRVFHVFPPKRSSAAPRLDGSGTLSSLPEGSGAHLE